MNKSINDIKEARASVRRLVDKQDRSTVSETLLLSVYVKLADAESALVGLALAGGFYDEDVPSVKPKARPTGYNSRYEERSAPLKVSKYDKNKVNKKRAEPNRNVPDIVAHELKKRQADTTIDEIIDRMADCVPKEKETPQQTDD
jgi:hypothetical protein